MVIDFWCCSPHATHMLHTGRPSALKSVWYSGWSSAKLQRSDFSASAIAVTSGVCSRTQLRNGLTRGMNRTVFRGQKQYVNVCLFQCEEERSRKQNHLIMTQDRRNWMGQGLTRFRNAEGQICHYRGQLLGRKQPLWLGRGFSHSASTVVIFLLFIILLLHNHNLRLVIGWRDWTITGAESSCLNSRAELLNRNVQLVTWTVTGTKGS